MATNVQLIADADKRPGSTAATSVYTSPANGGGTRVTQFNASLDTGTESYCVYSGATATASTKIIPTTSITGPASSTPADIINYYIPPGEELFIQVSTLTTIKFTASGIEL